MSFLTAVPAELAAAAAQLGAIGSSLAAQNAGAAAPTTAIAPAAADQVSVLQAGIFTALRHAVPADRRRSQAMQEQFVQTLGLSSGTYRLVRGGQRGCGQLIRCVLRSASPDDFINQASFLGGPDDQPGGQPIQPVGQHGQLLSFEIGNWASASSNMLGLAGGGLMPDGLRCSRRHRRRRGHRGRRGRGRPDRRGAVVAWPVAASVGTGYPGRLDVGAAELGRRNDAGVQHHALPRCPALAHRRPGSRLRRHLSRACPAWPRPHATARASVHRATASSPSSCPS